MKKPIPYNQVQIIERDTLKFGDPVFDNFISERGGIELGVMIALSGTSGAGKTTLCKKWQKDLQPGEVSVFYALESLKASVAKQTARIKTTNEDLICDVEDFPKWSQFMAYLYEDKPTMVVVDSLQHAAELLSEENGKYKYDNYKKIIKDLYKWKDETQGIVILICQLNEKGSMEGPASTLFNVDCPIKLTADPKSKERWMETTKNRMGPIGKIYYEFVDTDACIKFYTDEEWNFDKNNVSFPEMVVETVNTFLSSKKSDDKYSVFKKEFNKKCKEIYNNHEDDLVICSKVVGLVIEMEKKYFS
ncbi:MAG: RAD55 family ATPase [Candidatus Heimdallarchaeaceae archaeon]